MDGAVSPAVWVVWGGFALAFIFGFIANRTNFCTMGAISDVVNIGHWGRVRMWLLAITVAMLGANLLGYFGLIDLSKSFYQRPTLPWLSLLLGGTLFGVGMTIAGGCPNRNLIRLGAGSVRSLVVVVFVAISSYMTIKGLFAQWRVSYLDPIAVDLSGWGLPSQGIPRILEKLTGWPEKLALPVVVGILTLALLLFVLRDARFRANKLQVTGSIGLGALVVAGWYLTGNIGFGESPETLETVYFATNSRTLESFSFVAPTAYGLELLMLWTDKSLRLTFGVAAMLGVALGSFACAIATRQFRWEGFASMEDLRTQLVGAVLMGFGGVLALGCTIGQGMTGISTLALGSFISVTGIVLGAVGAMKWQQR